MFCARGFVARRGQRTAFMVAARRSSAIHIRSTTTLSSPRPGPSVHFAICVSIAENESYSSSVSTCKMHQSRNTKPNTRDVKYNRLIDARNIARPNKPRVTTGRHGTAEHSMLQARVVKNLKNIPLVTTGSLVFLARSCWFNLCLIPANLL